MPTLFLVVADWHDILGLETFVALRDDERDLLTVSERRSAPIVTLPCGTDGALMDKDFFTGFAHDEAESFGSVEPFDTAVFALPAVLGRALGMALGMALGTVLGTVVGTGLATVAAAR